MLKRPASSTAPARDAKRIRASAPPAPTSEQVTPTWGRTLIKKIEQASKKAPRFLFSGGFLNDMKQNAIVTPSGITPQHFLHAHMPTKFYHIPREEFCDHHEAYRTKPWPSLLTHALWSTWHQDLHRITKKAVEACAERRLLMDSVYIAVLDTKLLPSGNLVLHKKDTHLLEHFNRTQSSPGDQFLVLGTIPKSALAIVTLSTLHEQTVFEESLSSESMRVLSGAPFALTDIFDDAADWPNVRRERSGHRCSGDLSLQEEITIAKLFGKAFGNHFALPVACMAIAKLGRHFENQIDWLHDHNILKQSVVEGFKDIDFNRRSFRGISIMREKRCLLENPHARRGMNLFRTIVKSRQAKAKMHAHGSVDDLVDGLSRFKLGLLNGPLESEDGTDSVYNASNDPEDSDEDDEHEEEPSDADESALPTGIMSDKVKRRLLDAQNRTPRYLFRAWNNTDAPSGGFIGLNTPEAITPLAFLHKHCPTSQTIYDMPSRSLAAMCNAHLCTESDVYTEFSSWAASIQIAFRFARGAHKYCYISVIDTKGLVGKNVIFHVPSLEFLVGHVAKSCDHEYLAHGVISGPAVLKAIPLKAYLDAGVSIPPPNRLNLLNHAVAQITPAQVCAARRVAEAYGGQFSAAVFVAILTLERRSRNFWRSESELNKAVPLFVGAMKHCWIPGELCGDATILTDIVYTKGYENVEQMIKMLRALVDWRHGKGARVRFKQASWKDTGSP